VAAFQNFDEVWAALGRLYDDIVKLQESQQQTTAQLAKVTTGLDRVTERINRLAEAQERATSMVATLAGTVTQLASLVDSHERRLARMEGQ
jgi:ABC-type transporter Mla subunit MlaD